MKKAIIVDIDGTICDSRARMSESIREILGKYIPPEKVQYTVEANVSNVTKEEKRRIWKVFLSSRYISYDKPIPYSQELMKYFSSRGYSIFYLSSRPISMFDETMQWLKEYGYPEGTLILRRGFEKDITFKEKEVHQITIYYQVDYGLGDTPNDIIVYNKFEICSIAITTFYSKQKLLESGAKIIVSSWKEILDNPSILEANC